ncbi:MAG: prepilin-type N-terminal cleavage/methylation domain-containing protein [Gammaproteobacteria bacterium]|nr:prepilin-type N-terminal cleavage/methylation domain-containing protein [Gammaproteobacteria bacterium]
MQPSVSNHKGFTLIEVIVTTAIIAVVSLISTSAYTGYIDTTKNSQAANQIRTLSLIIDDYALENGEYPESLRDIGNENIKDPWGNPYVYLNLNSSNEQGDNEHGGSGGYGGGGSDGGSDENGGSDEYGNRGEYGRSDDDDNEHGRSDDDEHGRDDDDEHGRSNDSNYERSDDNHGGGGDTNIGAARKDGNLVPINTNYDLCSFGKDSKSKAPLRAKDSHDDIIYANDGAYIGLASEF